ncbi:transcriptional regulator [Chondromyces crocatus]|uniref:Transcriptional regulator n=1 Tax=Chondromyces crocatus TaxID=52 RepID=A0A0K1ESQ4_CHOCO|nr:transcriptional regulator [Chondromyces crocatus]
MKETPAGEMPRRIIKRYSNRKLYDTKDSRYVTLQQIGEMVRAGEEVQIIDNATKEDKTEVTLALIISEDLKAQPRSVPLGTLRDLIQERGERFLSTLREGPIGRLIPGGVEAGGAIPGSPEDAAEPLPPVPPAPAVAAATAEGDKAAGKSRLSGIVESSKQTLDQWQHAVDERIRTILPVVGLFRDLEIGVRQLVERVDTLERRIQELENAEDKPAAGLPSNGGTAGEQERRSQE